MGVGAAGCGGVVHIHRDADLVAELGDGAALVEGADDGEAVGHEVPPVGRGVVVDSQDAVELGEVGVEPAGLCGVAPIAHDLRGGRGGAACDGTLACGGVEGAPVVVVGALVPDRGEERRHGVAGDDALGGAERCHLPLGGGLGRRGQVEGLDGGDVALVGVEPLRQVGRQVAHGRQAVGREGQEGAEAVVVGQEDETHAVGAGEEVAAGKVFGRDVDDGLAEEVLGGLVGTGRVDRRCLHRHSGHQRRENKRYLFHIVIFAYLMALLPKCKYTNYFSHGGIFFFQSAGIW